jgi:putative transposase
MKEAGIDPAPDRQRKTSWKESLRTHLDVLAVSETVGIESVRLPARSPNLNAVAERFVLSIRESCLTQLGLIGESFLHRAVNQFMIHYHQERNHQGLDNKIISPEFTDFPSSGEIACRVRLSGMLRYYYRRAA